jgi:phosphoesterase RecJ-like protein
MTRAAGGVLEAAWQEATRLLLDARDVTLVCHVTPDGDALGSMLALAHALRGLGKRTTCTWGDERWAPPSAYTWLPGIEAAVPPAETPTETDVLVVLDTASRDRLGVLAPLADTARAVVVVDHHVHSGGLDGVWLVDTSAAATAVLVDELLRRLAVPLDPVVATCLYTGLVTDTGSFRHSVTTPAAHALAARLLDAGARPDEVAERLWGSRPHAELQLFGAALSRIRLEPEAADGLGLTWTWTSADDLAELGLGLDATEAVIDLVRQSAESDLAMVCKQDVDLGYRVSMRSRGAVDVGAVCAALGGGGHRLAAGFTSYDDLDTTVSVVRAALDGRRG